MKKTLIALLTLTSISAFSQVSADIRLGKGQWVCYAEGIDDYPTVARGQTKTEAKYFAKQACADYEGDDFFCDVEGCVRDKNRSNINIDIDFTVQRRGSRVTINLTNGKPGYVCSSEAWSKNYIAKAPTKLEAEVLARQTCISDGNHGMHCDIEECEAISPSRGSGWGGIDLGGGVRIGRGGISIGN